MRLSRCVLIFYTLMDGCNTQFDFSQFFNQQAPQQTNFAYQNFPQSNYYGNQQISPHPMNPMNNYNYIQQCACSCDKCLIPIPCCNDFCSKCGITGNPAVYLYPYPYIVVAPPPMHKATTEAPSTTQTTTTKTTTTELTTTEVTTTEVTTTETTTSITLTTEPPSLDPDSARRSGNVLRDEVLKKLIYDQSKIREGNGDIIMTALRRTKPRWMPRYGIVPIPDQIAEKLMLRIRHMKVLHPEADTIRRTDPI